MAELLSYIIFIGIFVKFLALPELTSGDVVTYAALRLVTPANTSTNSLVITASKVTSSWNSHTNGTTLTWANQPSISSTIEDYQVVTGQGEYRWDITDIAREWYQTGTNNGIALTFYPFSICAIYLTLSWIF